MTGIGYQPSVSSCTPFPARDLELPNLPARGVRILCLLLAVPVLATLFWTLLHAAEWQNSTRVLFGLEPLEAFSSLKIFGVAAAVFAVCFLLGWAVQWLFDWTRHRLYRIMPMRTANVTGLALVGLISFVVTLDGVVQSGFLDFADNSYAAAQDLFAEGQPAAGHGPPVCR